MNILYISYDGIFDPVGQSQVIPYLCDLVNKGIDVSLISFEKPGNRHRKLNEDIHWARLVYHKSPMIPATFFDILNGFLMSWFLIKKNRIKIVHSRGYIAGLIACLIKRFYNVKFIFDMRGFWPEEKLDSGAWKKNGFLYKLIKFLEKKIILRADEVVILTQAAKDILASKYGLNNLSVIPCCVDLKVFSKNSKAPINLPLPGNRLLIAYIGSIGSFYNFEGAVRFFRILRNRFPNAYFLVLSNGNKEFILRTLNNIDVKTNDYFVSSVAHDRVASFLSYVSLSLIFYRRNLSGPGCSPIKFSESLACGVPAVINAGVGDCDRIIKQERVGVILDRETDASYQYAIQKIECILSEDKESISERCRSVAEKYFSLERGTEIYFNIYQKLEKKN